MCTKGLVLASAKTPPIWCSLPIIEYGPPHTCDAVCRQPTVDWLHFAVLSASPVGPLNEGPVVCMHPDKPIAAKHDNAYRNI